MQFNSLRARRSHEGQHDGSSAANLPVIRVGLTRVGDSCGKNGSRSSQLLLRHHTRYAESAEYGQNREMKQPGLMSSEFPSR